MTTPPTHPFIIAPNRTLLTLTVPVIGSLIAEPLTGMVDTAFVAALGAAPLAALGVGTVALSSAFWVFNFLQVGTQTEIAQALGRGEQQQAARLNGLALVLSVLLSLLVMALALPLLGPMAAALGAEGAVQRDAVLYMQVRVFGTPAILAMITCFGVLRGMQDMQTPLVVAVAVNVLNIALDALLVFGAGPIPALGIAGAALASVLSQWLGALWVVVLVLRRLGLPDRVRLSDAYRLLHIGGDMFLRTGLLILFLLLTTRVATLGGAETGAAHQVIRQVWLFTGLLLDAFAITGQSLVAYFVGAGWLAQARRVAFVVCAWSVGTGTLLALLMLAGQAGVIRLFVPPAAVEMFVPAWLVAVVVQLSNALAFATDGIHWGTGDFAFLRNVMFLSTLVGGVALLLIDPAAPAALTLIWLATLGWSVIRAVLGVARIWPGIGNSPLRDRR
ncbi:MAG: MATE family efflux transporter [Chloroflexaceae bacterium]|nr:MATE family efflux transporter [Chloroflexaceae bacterium]NJO07445.1 MATE family efflux transporter [Chloroflexaceae bacterium]